MNIFIKFIILGSLVSLGAGVLFGSAAVLGAYLSSQNSKNFHLALFTAAALLVLMGFRFYNSGKFMPAGLLSGLSLFQSVRLAVRYTEKGKQQID
jgi:uncharacterized membrane protein (UPF0136 family)